MRFADIDPEACVIDVEDFAAQLSARTRVAAFNWASNGAGTISDVAELCGLTRDAGAISYVDAVQYAPHGAVDVRAGYDFLACSAYKFFGPHVGVLYGHGELLGTIEPYRVQPADYPPPQNWETGTVNLEGIAGTAAAARYLTDLGAERIAC